MQEATLHFNPNTPPSNLMLCFTRDEILNHIKVLRDEFSAVFSTKEIKNRLMPVLTTLMTDPDGERYVVSDCMILFFCCCSLYHENIYIFIYIYTCSISYIYIYSNLSSLE